MIANTITINDKSLLKLHRLYNVNFGYNTTHLIQEILDCTNTDICIRVYKEYLAKSYHKTPALYKRELQCRDKTKILSSYGEDNYIVVVRADTRYSGCFGTRARNAIIEYDTFHALKGSIPAIYLTHPKQFTRILERRFHCRFATIAKKSSITWSRRKADLDKLNSF